jgi:hypothetical protein
MPLQTANSFALSRSYKSVSPDQDRLPVYDFAPLMTGKTLSALLDAERMRDALSTRKLAFIRFVAG